MSHKITLDEQHRYRVDGELKPGVTEILDHNGLISDFSKNDFAAERGTAVHHGAALLFKGMLDWDSVDERIRGYLESLDKFIKTTRFVAISVEESRYHERYGYCGTYDVVGLFLTNGAKDHVLDLKSGSPQKSHRAQTAAYQELCGASRRGCVYLMADGSLAKLDPHDDPNDWRAFYSALKIYHGEKSLEKERNNLKAWLEG